MENDQKEFNFESWKKSTKQIINNFDHKNNTNTQKAITPFRIDDTKKRKENDLTAPDYNELELENTNKPTKHTIANDFLKQVI